jgi:outer membrane receptor protein involved in Fe transport
MHRRVILRVAVFLVSVVAPVYAQVGSITVRVLDAQEGVPLPNAQVTLSNEQGLIAETTIRTGPDGQAFFPVLRVGSGYVVEVSMPGFATHRLTDLRVKSEVNQQFEVHLTLEMQERVEVTARTNVVDLDRQEHTTKFDDTFIENLPIPGRFYQNMLSLAPGVNDEDQDGNPNVHGARTREFRGIVGGVANTDPLTGEWLSYINPASIEEMEIITAGAGVEFGRASGGFARIVQRQGSNEFEGVFSYLFRSSELDSSDATGVGGQERVDYEWHQPAILVSGPIIKDKLWYRLSHEWIKREEPIDFLTSVEVIGRKQRIVADQLTWQVSPRNKVAFQYQEDPLTVEYYGMDSLTSKESTHTLERGGPTYSVTWTAPHSPNLLVDTVVAYQDHQRTLTPTTQGAFNGCVRFDRFPTLDSARCVNLDTSRITGPHFEYSNDKRQRLTARSQATLYAGRALGMSHRLKFGLEIENERYYRKLDRGQDLRFHVLYSPMAPPVVIVDARVAAPRTGIGEATGVNWALYAEDQFRPLSNLTVTLGLRMDREEIDSQGHVAFDPRAEADAFYQGISGGSRPGNVAREVFTAHENIWDLHREFSKALGIGFQQLPMGNTGIQGTFWTHKRRADDIQIRNNNFSPRLSVAWDPWSNGKTKVAFSLGRYYDKIFLAVPILEQEPEEVELLFRGSHWVLQGYPITTNPMGGVSGTMDATIVDRELSTPYQDELTLNFERELWPETSIKLSYIKRNYRDQLQDVDINHRYGDEGKCIRTPGFLDPTVEASPGSGQTIRDPYTWEEYEDTDPGPGDGRIDDCIGDVQSATFVSPRWEIPDGMPDLYVLSPHWDELLLVGNFNSTDYEAFVLELVRRQYRNWQMNASYTWSEAIGDAEDFNQELGNERNLFENERGYLAYDQRHVVKVSAMTLAPWGLRIGGTLRWESGLPYSIMLTRMTTYAVPLDYGMGDRSMRTRLRYATGQRNDQRNPSYWNLDLRLAKEFSVNQRVQLQLTGEVFNVLDDHTLRLDSDINGASVGTRRFGRSFQLGVRLAF